MDSFGKTDSNAREFGIVVEATGEEVQQSEEPQRVPSQPKKAASVPKRVTPKKSPGISAKPKVVGVGRPKKVESRPKSPQQRIAISSLPTRETLTVTPAASDIPEMKMVTEPEVAPPSPKPSIGKDFQYEPIEGLLLTPTNKRSDPTKIVTEVNLNCRCITWSHANFTCKVKPSETTVAELARIIHTRNDSEDPSLVKIYLDKVHPTKLISDQPDTTLFFHKVRGGVAGIEAEAPWRTIYFDFAAQRTDCDFLNHVSPQLDASAST